MRILTALAIAPLLALLPPVPPQDQEPALGEADFVTPERRDFTDAIELDGRFIPADYDEIGLWPEAYAGGLLFLEVTPHGTFVNEGDVIARFDTESIEDQIESAERDLVTTRITHENAAERARIDTEAEDFRLGDAVIAFKLARRSLEGWETFELPFHHRSDQLSRQQIQHGIDDQVDELAQLESMYRDDELVDATEEIVLSRSRRGLATSRTRQQLNLDRMAHSDEYDIVEAGHRRVRAVESQKGSLDRLVRSLELGRRSRANGLVQSEVALAKAQRRLDELVGDRELLTVRAPRAGVVLHGGGESYLPGKQRPVHRRGGHGSFRTPLFCVAAPDALAAALFVSESQIGKVREGMSVRTTPVVFEDRTVVGSLELQRYPTPASASASEASFEGKVTLEPRLRGVVVGMRAKLELIVEEIDGALLLPSTVIFHDDDGDYCWSASAGGGDPVRVALTLGPDRDGEVVVSGDLDENTHVLLEEPKE
jgi:HlyD family secretion protein